MKKEPYRINYDPIVASLVDLGLSIVLITGLTWLFVTTLDWWLP